MKRSQNSPATISRSAVLRVALDYRQRDHSDLQRTGHAATYADQPRFDRSCRIACRSRETRTYRWIGASSGGLETLKAFFGAIR
jgi:hypothetical protein